MEDSAFSSEFATSFLTWDDGETAAPAPGPAESLNSKQTESATGAAPMTQQSVNIQQQNQQNAQDRYSWLPQYQVMMGNPAGGQQLVMAQGPQFAPAPHMLNMATQSFQGMMSHSQTHANAMAVGLANMQQNTSTHQEGLGASHMAAAGHNATQLHPLGIQSSANCPPHVPTASFLPLVYNPFLQPGAVAPNQQLWTMVHANQQQQFQQAQQQQQNQLAQQQYQQAQQQQQNQQQQQQQNYQAQLQQNHQAQQQNHQMQQQNQQAQQQNQQGQQQNQQVQQQNNKVQQQNHQVPLQNNQVQQPVQKQTQQSSQGSQQTPVPAPTVVTQAHPIPVGPAPTITTQPNGKPMPPFYLFDAPCELRANFLQSQSLHNLPVSEDNNSFHYGMVVNGFHPQRNAVTNPVHMHVFPPLVDGRSKKSRKAGSERNEREQKRAQKITDLIETLRYSMEKGGWKVEMKSKYHTLSTCADYIKHLAQATKEKEELVKKAKTELEMTERKLEEEKATVERSDPESVASSLTCGSKRKDKREGDGERHSDQDEDVKVKRVKINDTTSETSSNESQRRSGPGMKNISLDKMSSGISDISDSNKGSSKSGDGTNGKSSEERCLEGAVSPVASNGNSNEDWGHADVVVKVRKQQRVLPEPVEKNREMTSLDSDFELDYNEVFVSSNVPQLIATPTGRIVTCNDFLVKAIGLSKEDVSRLTIFSLVQADKLSSLFEMVAEALRCDRNDRNRVERSEDGSGGEGSDSSGNTTNESSKSGESRRWTYPSMTLPCVSFPSRTKPGSPHHPNPLYMTISLMTDEDPKKRCFHCMLTDDPGTNGSVGFITPELLALLFSPEPPRSSLLRDQTSKSKTESRYHAQSSSSYGDDNRTDSYMFNEDEDEDDDDDITDTREASEF